jgi:SSS family transporter
VTPVLDGILIMYMAVLVVVGIISARRVKGEGAYLVADRKLGTVVLGSTLPATQLSAGTAIGTVGYIATYGYFYNWFWIALWAGWLISMFFVAPRMYEFGRKHDGMTIPDILGARFGNSLRFIGALALIGSFLLLFSAEYEGAATVFNDVFGINYTVAVLISAAIIAIYALLGGLFSVARNDTLQMAVFIVGYIAAAAYAMHSAGGFGGLETRLNHINPQLMAPFGNKLLSGGALIGMAIGTLVTFIAYPLDAMKFYAAKKRSVLMRAMWIGIGLQAIVAICLAFIGSAGRALYPASGPVSTAEMDNVAPFVALHTMPPVLGGLLMAAVLGAVMAVSSSIVMIVSAAFSRDLLPFLTRRAYSDSTRLRIERIAAGVAVLIGVGLSVRPVGSVGTIVLIVQQFMASTFAVVLIAALNWKRASVPGAIVSMIAGFAGVVAWYAAGDPFGLEPVYLGLPLSFIGMVGVSLLPRVKAAPTVIDPPRSRRGTARQASAAAVAAAEAAE